MEYQKLKEEIKAIAEVTALVPEPLREKCFEMLLGHLLGSPVRKPEPDAPKGAEAKGDNGDTRKEPLTRGGQLSLPAGMKAFLRRTGLTVEELEAVVMIADEEFHFIKQPSHQKIAQGQNEWALLLALRNGITNNSLAVDPEAVRSVVQDKGYYDQANFAGNFKKQKYVGWYKDTMERQGEARALTQEGERELAALIKRLITE